MAVRVEAQSLPRRILHTLAHYWNAFTTYFNRKSIIETKDTQKDKKITDVKLLQQATDIHSVWIPRPFQPSKIGGRSRLNATDPYRPLSSQQ